MDTRNTAPKGKNPKVLLAVVDGVRLDTWENGFPHLRALGGAEVRMRVSNPIGISLPAYADILSGARQSGVSGNELPPDHRVPRSVFSSFGGALVTSWEPIDWLVPEPVSRSCATRLDRETLGVARAVLAREKPSFLFLHLGDADEDAHHFPEWARYQAALDASDEGLASLWAALQSDLHYRDSTTLLVTTDHGRELDNWREHGECAAEGRPLCRGCVEVFAYALGPNLAAGKSPAVYSHLDLAPTVAGLLGLEFTTGTGTPIREFLPSC